MTAQEKDLNGFIEIKDNPLSKAGVYEYYGYEIGAPEPDKLYHVLRSPEQLEKAVDLFKGKPIVNDHTMIGEGELPAEKKGIEGSIGDDVYFKDGTIYGNLRLYTNRIKKLIAQGKKDLSFGYWSRYEFTKGQWQGKAYDAIQHIVGGNHLALVDEGRMGSTVAVLDSKPKLTTLIFTFDQKGIPMEDNQNYETPEEEDREAIPTEDFGEDPQHEQEEMITLHSLAKEVAELKGLIMAMHGAPAQETADEFPPAEENEEEETNPTMDAKSFAKQVQAEISKKAELFALVKPMIGTFDHSAMSAEQVASYAAKKLGLSGEPETAIRAYSQGLKKAQIKATQDHQPVKAKIEAGVYS